MRRSNDELKRQLRAILDLPDDAQVQEQVVVACFDVLRAAQGMERKLPHGWPASHARSFREHAEQELAMQLRVLHELSGDDATAWAGRVDRLRATPSILAF